MPITLNPVLTTVASGSFTVQTDGEVQGTFFYDPAVRFALRGGYVASTETLPMWGGIAIGENIPNLASGNPQESLGSGLVRATALTGITGFTVFDQAHNMVTTPQSPVPLSASGMGVNYFRLGSGARIAVACDPVLASLEGGLTTQQVSWDFSNQRLVPFNAAYASVSITAASWASTGGGQATFTTSAVHGVGVGEDITITGVVPSGYNGSFTTITGTTGSTLVVAMTVNPGAYTSGGTLVGGGGALAAKVDHLSIGNSMTVVYATVTGFATWNYSGSTAVIQI